MRRLHFERWQPRCLACRAAGRDAPALTLARSLREDQGDVLEGVLVCPSASCQREYPIVDGIPILVLDVRSYLGGQLPELRARDDLSPVLETLLGDAAGPDSAFEHARYHRSIYGWGHWGERADGSPALVELLDAGLALMDAPATDSWIDIGCAVGRGTFEMAARTGAPTLGVDLNIGMLRLARRILRTGRVEYALRREGLVYDQVSYELAIERPELIDFWACDATGLALTDGSFDGALSLNLVDCVPSPLGHLIEMGRVLAPGAPAVLTTPYDWSSEIPLEGWIGGHSQRSEHGGSSPAALRHVLSMDGDLAPALSIAREIDDVPWTVRTHARAEMRYRAHVCLLRAG